MDPLQKARTGDPTVADTRWCAGAEGLGEQGPNVTLSGLEVCSLRGSASSLSLLPHDLEQLHWSGAADEAAAASLSRRQSAPAPPSGPFLDQEARDGQGQARPCLAACLDVWLHPLLLLNSPSREPLPPLRIRRRSIHPHRPLIDDPYNTHSAFAHNLVELSTSIDCTTLPETIGFGHCQSPDLITGQFHQRHLFAPFRNIHLSTIVHPTLDTLEPLHPAAMPYRLDTHVLTVDANVIHKVDTGNPANLYSMWTVFSRCADSVEQGRRLENLSWRLWQREQLIDNAHRSTVQSTKTAPRDIPSEARLPELPQLSGSVDSLADEDTPEFTSVSAPPRDPPQNTTTRLFR
ncbi:hypothetical protein TrVGV298_008982 [Trichoderma virens]|nr:hypothetical protein TrVGV298_008982 [Trichoderma virens]